MQKPSDGRAKEKNSAWSLQYIIGSIAIPIGLAALAWWAQKDPVIVVVPSPDPGPEKSTIVKVEDPLEVVTKRGYKPDVESLTRAAKLNRLEDVELLLKLGVTLNSNPLREFHVSNELWSLLLANKAVPGLPCEYSGEKVINSYFGDWGLLTGAAEHGNVDIYKGLCGGAYIASIRRAIVEVPTKVVAENSRIAAEQSVRLEKFAQAKARCIQKLDALFTDKMVDDYLTCGGSGNTPKDIRKRACDASAAVDQTVGAVAKELTENGFAGTLEVVNADCVSGECKDAIGFALANHYYYWVLTWKEPISEYRKIRKERIDEACNAFAPPPPALKKVEAQGFFEDFQRIIGQ